MKKKVSEKARLAETRKEQIKRQEEEIKDLRMKLESRTEARDALKEMVTSRNMEVADLERVVINQAMEITKKDYLMKELRQTKRRLNS